MKQRFQVLLTGLILFMGGYAAFVASQIIFADGIGRAPQVQLESPIPAGGAFSSLDAIITRGVPGVLISFVGVTSLVFFLINGWKYLGSASNEQGVNDAKQGMLYAAVGLLLALLSYAIVALLNGYFR